MARRTPDTPRPLGVEKPMLLALGTASDPTQVHARVWKRRVFAPYASQIALRFLIGGAADRTRMEEADDIVVVESARDGRGHRSDACAVKTYAWYALALKLLPWATHVGKTDDDTYVVPERLLAALAAAPAHRLYLGDFREAKFRVDALSLCYGDCLACHGDRCAPGNLTNRRVFGPYTFAVGALHVVSRDVARHIRDWGTFWRAGNVSVTCAHEDAALGYFLTSRLGDRLVRWPIEVVDVAELYAKCPVATHRVFPNPDHFREKARSEHIENQLFETKGVKPQFHLHALHRANSRFAPPNGSAACNRSA